ncbi:MAG: sulfatase-like hydrolase/transferase, partial [Bacteroidota bacterium]|nr:sulfatase-like hydrolase/transferase [Bacteroidota bacterium]
MNSQSKTNVTGQKIIPGLLGIALGSLLTVSCSTGKGTAPAETKRPNIIVILSDDIGYSDIGPYGSEIKTPSLDRLASEGVRFT